MPRRVASQSELKDDAKEGETISYLDNFLTSITDTHNLPGDLKKTLSQLRELDTQAQELYERMMKQSKNHIQRTKRSVQSGNEPDDELLLKARRLHKELLEVDGEKVRVAEQSRASICKHLERCESELQKFEEELRDKGQLKAPPTAKTELSVSIGESAPAAANSVLSQPSLSVDTALDSTSAATPAPSPRDVPPQPASVGRRGRQPVAPVRHEPPTPTPSHSHKRGRGRKVSFKEAERQRLAAEERTSATARSPRDDGYAAGGGSRGFEPAPPAAPPAYPDSLLPLASREESHKPLCGAVPPAPNYILPERTKVAARPSAMDDWILAVVLRYNSLTNKYVVLDVDAGDEPTIDRFSPAAGSRQHTLSSKVVLPLPLTEPSAYSSYNEYQQGQLVLALYPDTTCFYRAFVNLPPSQSAPNAQHRRDYLIQFEDENEASGLSEPMRVPQKYVLPLRPESMGA